MKSTKIYLFIILSAALSACIDDDLNIDPNRPSSVPTTSLIITAEKQLLDIVRGQSASLRSSALFIQQLSQNTYTSQSRYDIPFDYSEEVWSGLYSVLNDLQEIINLNTHDATKNLVTANGAGRNASQIAISRILKSYAYGALTEIFGDVPYNSQGNNDADFKRCNKTPTTSHRNTPPRKRSMQTSLTNSNKRETRF